MTRDPFPVGKLPAAFLEKVLSGAPLDRSRVLLGPGIGLDCAVVDFGDRLLVCKSDPVTFVSADLGHYLVQVNANDIATTGACPLWLLVTLLLPEGKTSIALVDHLTEQIYQACRELGISVIGGHTEITYGLERPLAIGTLLGEVARDKLITPRGARPGDRILLTKGVPIEGTTILAREVPARLRQVLNEDELREAGNFLHTPGISVVRDASVALAAGTVTAMHDPTEGGLSMALWELAQASEKSLRVTLEAVPVPELSARICQALSLDPFSTIASGALLLTVPATDRDPVVAALRGAGIPCADIGEVGPGPALVQRMRHPGLETLPMPERDEIARLFERARARTNAGPAR